MKKALGLPWPTDKHREPCRIERAEGPHVEPDHGILTVEVAVGGRDGGWGQGCFGIALDTKERGEDFMRDLCNTFGVSKPTQLVGEFGYALHSFPYGPINGLESEKTGKIFLLNKWRRKHWPTRYVQTHAEEAIDDAKRNIERLKQQLAEARKNQKTVLSRFYDWEKQCG